MNLNKRILIASAAAIAIFIAITCIYFRQGLSGKYVLSQSDVRQFKGAAKEIQDFRAANGEEALWTNSMFGGMPAYQISVLYANRALGIVNRTFQCFLPQPLGMAILYFIGFFILLLCLKIDPWLAIIGAIAYGFSSYFFIIIEVGHNTKAIAIGYAPALLGGVILLFRQKYLLGFIATTLFMGLELYANHPQITYYLFLLIGIYLLVEFFGFLKEKKIKEFFLAVAILLGAISIGTLPNIGNLWTTSEYGKFTTRGPSELTIKPDRSINKDKDGLPIDYATGWSYGVGESFTLLVPNWKGGADDYIGTKNSKLIPNEIDEQNRQQLEQSNMYFGDQPGTSGPVYVGCIVVLLSIVGMFVIRNRIKWALFIGSLLALMLSWGKNFEWFTQLFFDNVPYYNKFRSVSMLLVIVELALPLLAILALNQLIIDNGTILKEKAKKGVIIGVGSLFLFLLTCLIYPTLLNTFHSSNEETESYMVSVRSQLKQQIKKQEPTMPARQLEITAAKESEKYREGYEKFLSQLEQTRTSFFKSDVVRTLGIVFLGSVLLLIFVYTKIPKEIFILGIGTLILCDLWTVDLRYLNKDSYKLKDVEQKIAYANSDDYILNDKEAINYRVINTGANPFNNASISYYHKSIGGYHGAKLKRFQELREFYLDDELDIANQIANAGLPDSLSIYYLNNKTPILNMLNTRYIVTQKNYDSIPFLNKAANGNAWFVSKIKWAPNADSEVVWTGTINSKTTAVINEKYKTQLVGNVVIAATWANIKLTNYKPNYLKYDFESKSKQLIVFSEMYYSAGWNAYVDGKITPHVCANFILRAMMIPEGKHLIEFKFEPVSYFTGEKISFIGVILWYLIVLCGLGFVIYQSVKTKKHE